MIGIALLDGYRQVGFNRWSGVGSGCVALSVRYSTYSTLEVREGVSEEGKGKGWREYKGTRGREKAVGGRRGGYRRKGRRAGSRREAK